jgi:hypothetical protein
MDRESCLAFTEAPRSIRPPGPRSGCQPRAPDPAFRCSYGVTFASAPYDLRKRVRANVTACEHSRSPTTEPDNESGPGNVVRSCNADDGDPHLWLGPLVRGRGLAEADGFEPACQLSPAQKPLAPGGVLPREDLMRSSRGKEGSRRPRPGRAFGRSRPGGSGTSPRRPRRGWPSRPATKRRTARTPK